MSKLIYQFILFVFRLPGFRDLKQSTINWWNNLDRATRNKYDLCFNDQNYTLIITIGLSFIFFPDTYFICKDNYFFTVIPKNIWGICYCISVLMGIWGIITDRQKLFLDSKDLVFTFLLLNTGMWLSAGQIPLALSHLVITIYAFFNALNLHRNKSG